MEMQEHNGAHLLHLPLELRQQIYSYLLPRTIRLYSKKKNDVVWIRGRTAILAVNRQIHEEAAVVMYGDNTFQIELDYGHILFWYRTLLPSGLCPCETPSFDSFLSSANLALVKRVTINVKFTDSYTGMIKYNCGGSGLIDGLQARVQQLVDILVNAEPLQSVQVQLVDWDSNVKTAKQILRPFEKLSHVQIRLQSSTRIKDRYFQFSNLEKVLEDPRFQDSME